MRNSINQRSGAHIVIENNTKIPSIASKGLSVMPGTETNIGVTSKTIRRLGRPYKSNCTNNFDAERVRSITGNRFRYSSKICKGMCYARIFLEYCRCVHPSLVEGIELERWMRIVTTNGVRICNVTKGSADYTCLHQMMPKVAEGNVCDCNPECYEGKYRVGFLLMPNIFKGNTIAR